MYFYFKISELPNAQESREKIFSTNLYRDFYQRLVTKHEKIREKFNNFLTPDSNSVIDVQGIIDNMFPLDMDFKVFISHSSKDDSQALFLATMLYDTYGINSFIDSVFWEHKLDLQKEIDNKFCMHSNESSYDYDKRNITTTHVNIILAHALKEMMDKCECVIFLDTPNSINVSQDIDNQSTYSPWIFHELSTLKTLRKNDRPTHLELTVHASSTKMENFAEDSIPKLKYNITLDMPNVTLDELLAFDQLIDLCDHIEQTNKIDFRRI